MNVFKIRKDGFKEIKKQMLTRAIPILVIAVTAGIVIASINSKQKATDVNILPITIPLIAAAIGFGLYRGINRQQSLFESYTLTITSNLVTREQFNTATISVYFDEIGEIAKHKNGSFTIKGKERADIITIPLQIDNYAQLEILLQQIQPVVVKDKVPLLEQYAGLTSLLTLGLMLSVFAVNNKVIVGLTGSALVALMVWSIINIRSSKNIDNKTKQILWWMLLVIASVIAVMVLKLTG